MAYGTQVTINGVDMVSIVDPLIYLDFIISPVSGSRSYSVPAGMTLQFMMGTNSDNRAPNVSISGNTITWNNVSQIGMLYVFAGY